MFEIREEILYPFAFENVLHTFLGYTFDCLRRMIGPEFDNLQGLKIPCEAAAGLHLYTYFVSNVLYAFRYLKPLFTFPLNFNKQMFWSMVEVDFDRNAQVVNPA